MLSKDFLDEFWFVSVVIEFVVYDFVNIQIVQQGKGARQLLVIGLEICIVILHRMNSKGRKNIRNRLTKKVHQNLPTSFSMTRDWQLQQLTGSEFASNFYLLKVTSIFFVTRIYSDEPLPESLIIAASEQQLWILHRYSKNAGCIKSHLSATNIVSQKIKDARQ